MIALFCCTQDTNSRSDYYITKDDYLSAKNEMIDRDLANISGDLSRTYTKWCLGYIRENRDEIFCPVPEEDIPLQESLKGNDIVLDALRKEDFDLESLDADTQKYVARYVFRLYL